MGASLKTFIVVAIVGVILLIGWIYSGDEPEETPVDDQCQFVVKTSDYPAHISEPTAGEYHYQVIASSDGYVTILKCQ